MRTQLDLFSGIGGFALACRWAGVQTIGFAEIEPYACRVLAKNFPGVTNYGDIRNVPGHDAIGPVWLLTGGFPCQPFSVAGQQRGASDDRFLWPEMASCIARVRPRWVLAENVPGIIGMELDRVLLDLENLGYTAWPVVIPAVAVDAPHRRDRVWIVANAESQRICGDGNHECGWQHHAATREPGGSCLPAGISNSGTGSSVEEWPGQRDKDRFAEEPCFWQPEPGILRVAHGVPRRMERLRGLGNAIVPQVAYELIRMMIAAEEQDDGISRTAATD